MKSFLPLLQLFICDYQPYSIVEDKGFVNFVTGLNQNYKLPNRKTITNSMIPAEYEACHYALRMELNSVESVCLTTDTWTSANVENYLAVTAHYISKDFEFKSVLLECSQMTEAHTSVNLAEEIKKIADTFHLMGKITLIVSDNARDITGAVLKVLKVKHFGCFAHTLNLILQDALKEVKWLVDKMKTIVTYFKRSTTATKKLNQSQRQLGLEPKKLLQEVPTRWNSTYYMLSRITELKDPVKTTIALINKDLPILTEEEWKVCQELSVVLEPFEEVTKKISGEVYVTGSQVIPLKNGLTKVCMKMRKESFTPVVLKVVDNLIIGLGTRLANIEANNIIALSTLLDPRFKVAVFTDDSSVKSVKTHCTELMAPVWNEATKKQSVDVDDAHETSQNVPAEESKKYSVWEDIDGLIARKKPTGTKTSAAVVELNRYLDDGFLNRKEKKDPLVWWRENKFLYPLLSQVVLTKFNVVATSYRARDYFLGRVILLRNVDPA